MRSLFSFLLPAFPAEPVSTGFWSSTAIDGRDNTVSYHADANRKAHQVATGDWQTDSKQADLAWNALVQM